jgi:hypothetical protein
VCPRRHKRGRFRPWGARTSVQDSQLGTYPARTPLSLICAMRRLCPARWKKLRRLLFTRPDLQRERVTSPWSSTAATGTLLDAPVTEGIGDFIFTVSFIDTQSPRSDQNVVATGDRAGCSTATRRTKDDSCALLPGSTRSRRFACTGTSKYDHWR